jgi:predicted transcriptional regulator
MPEVTTVRMRTDTKALLDDLKFNPRETYDDEPLTREEIEAMEEGIADIKAGRVRPLRDVMRDLGDDKKGTARGQ